MKKTTSKPLSKTNGYVLNVMSDDRPGIVASVSSAIAQLNGNIESCSQTVLNGYFTLIMTFTLAKKLKPTELEKKLQGSEGMQDCQLMIRPMSEANTIREPAKKENTFVVTAFGKDREAIVAHFSQYLADKNINILDLYGNKTADGDFVLVSQVEVDPKLDIKVVQFDLEEMGEEFDFHVGLQHNNIFVATNQLRLDT